MAESIFTDQTPALTDANDNTAYTLATLWTPAVDGTVTHGRWRFPGTLPSQPVVFALYRRDSDAAGEELARATFTDPVAGAWNTVALAAPEPVTAGDYYYAAVWTSNRYVATGGFFTGTSVTSGNLTAPADDTVIPRRNGRFNDFGTEPNFPDTQFDGGCYFADIVFEPSGGEPVAVVEHRTLVAATVTTVTLTLAEPVGDLLSFATPAKGKVGVASVSGASRVYFTTDGSTPTVGGANCYVLPAALCELVVADETAGGTAVVKLISSGTPDVSVRGVL